MGEKKKRKKKEKQTNTMSFIGTFLSVIDIRFFLLPFFSLPLLRSVAYEKRFVKYKARFRDVSNIRIGRKESVLETKTACFRSRSQGRWIAFGGTNTRLSQCFERKKGIFKNDTNKCACTFKACELPSH